jgi:hypothetical protein
MSIPIILISGIIITIIFRFLLIQLFKKLGQSGIEKKATYIAIFFLIFHWIAMFIVTKYFNIPIFK